MTFEMLVALFLLLLLVNFIYLDCTISKMKKDRLKLDVVAAIIALEKAVKKLNEALKIHEHRLDHERDEIYGINKRLDILEEDHPDSDIDYGTVDDHDDV